jgi:pyridoxine 5'-phosphate synthase PdxJ
MTNTNDDVIEAMAISLCKIAAKNQIALFLRDDSRDLAKAALSVLLPTLEEVMSKLNLAVAYADDGAAISARRCLDEALAKLNKLMEAGR